MEMAEQNFTNLNLVLKVIEIALKLGKKESLWSFIINLVLHKKARFRFFDFWKV